MGISREVAENSVLGGFTYVFCRYTRHWCFYIATCSNLRLVRPSYPPVRSAPISSVGQLEGSFFFLFVFFWRLSARFHRFAPEKKAKYGRFRVDGSFPDVPSRGVSDIC